jgi:hypothetical protein
MEVCHPANEHDCGATAGHRLAIIGAGPVGIELALSALQRGMRVAVFERGASAGSQVLSWNHVKLFSPWSMNMSDSGRRVLENAGLQAPVGDHFPTGGEFVTQYLQPLAEHIEKHSSCSAVHYNARVLAVGRGALLKGESIGGGDVEMPVGRPQAGRTRSLTPFRLLVSHDDCSERYHEGFDFVCDCSGSYRSLLLLQSASHVTLAPTGANQPTGAARADCPRLASGVCGHRGAFGAFYPTYWGSTRTGSLADAFWSLVAE